jgi:hypothetical protein
MLCQPGKLRVRPGARQDLSIPFGDRASALALKCSRDHCGATSRVAGGDNPIDELNELV